MYEQGLFLQTVLSEELCVTTSDMAARDKSTFLQANVIQQSLVSQAPYLQRDADNLLVRLQ